MSLRKSEDFISDVERQFEWYASNANWEIAERFFEAVEATFYEVDGADVHLRRAMHGHRDLPRRLLEPPQWPDFQA